MTTVIKFGYIQFGGYKLFATPENYQTYTIGTKSQPIPRANGSILDINYGYKGFNIKSHVLDGAKVNAIANYIQSQLNTGSPISVSDTLYPGGTSWSGFFEPLTTTGQVVSGGLYGLPANLMLEEISLTFYSVEEVVI